MRDWFGRPPPALYAVLAASIAVAAVVLLDRARDEPEPVVLELRTPAGREIRVEVTGAVASPGVFSLRAGDRVIDALTLAGGALEDADLSRVNQASTLVDGQRIEVPLLGATPVPGLIDLNSASAAVLEALPGIGPGRAVAIVESRLEQGPFMRLEELAERRLVPASLLEQIRPLVTLGP